MLRLIAYLIVFTSVHIISYAQIRINEICASNTESLYDEDADTPDWIELYNYSAEPVNLKDYRISDRNDLEIAWQLPDTVIQPNNYFLVYASGKNRTSKSLKISSNGLSTTTDYFYDNLSMLYLPLKGNNEFKVKYNSYYYDIDTNTLYSSIGIIFKDKLEPFSRMVGLMNSHQDLNTASTIYRLKKEYRHLDPIKGRLDFEDLSFAIKRLEDSVKTVLYDKNDYPLLERSYYIPNVEDYFIGLTVLTRNKNIFQEFNVNSIKLNNVEVDINNLKVKNFYESELNWKLVVNNHSNFKLNKSSDAVYLFKNAEIEDSVGYTDLGRDESFSYFQNEFHYTSPTPNEKNKEGYVKKSILDLDIAGSIFSDSIQFNNIDRNIYFDSDFKSPNSSSLKLNDHKTKETSLLTLRSFEEDKQNSNLKYLSLINRNDILTNDYHFFINSDSFELFNPFYGIIGANFSKKRINSHLSLVKGGELIYESNITLKKQGNFSNIDNRQSSLRLMIDDDLLSDSNFSSIFRHKNNTYSNDLILRNGGHDHKLYVRDLFAQFISTDLEIEWSDFNSALVYINNKFWGLYNIRERINDNYIANKYNIDNNDINMFENQLWTKYGSQSDLIELYKNLHTYTDEGAYNRADSLINLRSFYDYFIAQLFVINHDWPHNNVYAWSSSEHKWKFILNDLDFGLKLFGAGASTNNIETFFNIDSIFIVDVLNKIIKYGKCKIDFLNRNCDILNTFYSKKVLLKKYELVKDKYLPLVGYQNERWPNTLIEWEENIEVIKRFVDRRTNYFYDYLKIHFDVKGGSELDLTTYPPNSGTFIVNTIKVDTSEWTGRYFQTIPVTITAVPKHGMKFVKWNHDSLGTESTITTTLPESIQLEAIYEKINLNELDRAIVINEIMYNADKDNDSKDWIELYNAGTESVNLNGWTLIDEDTSHTKFVINNDYHIQPKEFIILTKEKSEFDKFISITNTKFGDFSFGLGGNDIVRLIDEKGVTHDSVNYDNDEPWPIDADGTGYTIELINPILDNNIGTNWKKSKLELGSAGLVNSVTDTTTTDIHFKNFSSSINFKQKGRIITLESSTLINDIELFSITGSKLNLNLDEGINRNITELDLSNCNRGVYILVFHTEARMETIKILLK